MQLVLQQRSGDGKVSTINVVNERGQCQESNHAPDGARSLADLIVDGEGQVSSADIVYVNFGCGKGLFAFCMWGFGRAEWNRQSLTFGQVKSRTERQRRYKKRAFV